MAAPKQLVFKGPQLSARLQTDPAGVIEVPGRQNPGVVIHVGRAVRIACDRGGRRHQGLSVHGDVDVVPGGIASRWETKSDDTSLILGVSVDLLRSIAEEFKINRGRAEIINRFQMRDPRIENIGWAVKAEMESGYSNGSLYLDSLAAALAIHLLNRHSSESPSPAAVKSGMSGYRLKKVLAYVDDHVADHLSLAELANVAGLSISHFSASFRASVGQPVHQYVTRRRVERARILLKQGAQPISQIAVVTGFAHASHLAFHMRRLLGISPRQLANQS